MSLKISFGSLTNHALDAIGLPDSIGDTVGAVVDFGSGNIPGALQNALDLISDFGGFSPQAMAAASRRPDFSAAHLPRPEAVGEQTEIGSRYAYKRGTKWVTGRITGKKYRGSFAKPIRLKGDRYMHRGRLYANLDQMMRDALDGRMDGLDYRKSKLYSSQLFDTMAGLFGSAGRPGATNGNDAVSGGSSEAAANASGASDASSWDFLRDPSISLEEKLMLLMAKLAEHYDDEINKKMGEIEKATSSGAAGTHGQKDSSDLQTLQVKLQTLMQQRQQMFQTVTAMMRSLHDTSMAAIRNLKA